MYIIKSTLNLFRKMASDSMDDDALCNTLVGLARTLKSSVATMDDEERAKISNALFAPGPDYSSQVLPQGDPTTPYPPSSTAPGDIAADFPDLPSFTKNKSFTDLGSSKLPIDMSKFVWRPPSLASSSSSSASSSSVSATTQELPKWYVLLMDILSDLMHVLWAANYGEQPGETKRVQPVLEVVLSLICAQLSRGKASQLSGRALEQYEVRTARYSR
jgi:hypothetical protein